MNLIPNIIALAIAGGFTIVYIVNFIINLVRAKKVNKAIKNSPDFVDGKIIDVIKGKKRVYIKVEYVSDKSGVKFENVFELTEKEFNDQYFVGQEIKIFYAKQENQKRITCFPIYLEGQKTGIEMGPMVTDIILFVGGLYIFISMLFALLQVDKESGLIGLQWNGRPFVDFLRFSTATGKNPTPVFNILYIFIIIIFYVMLFSYVKERLSGMTQSHKQNYLKLCGSKGTAQVKTYKFNKSKNSEGVKESMLEIEFFTNSGEKVNCSLNSFLYTETQEEYIDILYDEKNPKNVVYMRK